VTWTMALAAALLLAGCDASSLERSCRGERVLTCDPEEWTVVRSASLEPSRIGPLDPAAMPAVHVVLDECAMRPTFATVQLQALLDDPDAGGAVVSDLGITVRDDGTLGDAVADDGRIDVTIRNPFGLGIPESTALRLRFVPVLGGCTGQALEVPYTTGVRPVP